MEFTSIIPETVAEILTDQTTLNPSDFERAHSRLQRVVIREKLYTNYKMWSKLKDIQKTVMDLITQAEEERRELIDMECDEAFTISSLEQTVKTSFDGGDLQID